MHNPRNIRIVEYEPRHADAFRDLNLAWIEEYFEIEEIDRQQLDNPEATIIRQGGAILVAEDPRGILGVCGLRYDSPGRYEVTKMGVREDMRGCGIGQRLLSEVIKHASLLGAEQLYIISNTVLAPAIRLYRKLGFVEIPQSTQKEYVRGNIELELNLNEQHD
jgi:N-acetylglutamate synthase-like GNAT family acetyltransferase